MTASKRATMDSTVERAITIEKIELQTESRRMLPVPRRHQLEFSVGGTSRMTKMAQEKGTHTFWDETLFFDGDNHTLFLVKVIQNHRTRKDEIIGTLTATVGGVLARLKDDILEEPLHKHTSSGSELLGTMIKFSLVEKQHDRVGLDADDLQAKDAVDNAIKETYGLGGSTPGAVSNPGYVVKHQDAFSTLLNTLKRFNDIAAAVAEIRPFASLALSVISAANNVFLNQQDNDEQIIRLTGAMNGVFEFVYDTEPLKKIEGHIKGIRLLTQQVAECGYFIAEYTRQKNFWISTAKYTLADVDGKVRDYQNRLNELKAAFLEGAALQAGIIVICMMNMAEHTTEAIDLDDMPYAYGARYVQKEGYLDGTHESLFSDIQDFLNDSNHDAPQLCLLTGPARSGKSAIACSIAQLYDGQNRLGSSYHFCRSDLARRNPQNLFSTIACDLCEHVPQYKSALRRVVKDDREIRVSTSPLEQLERLIVEPGKYLDPIGPLIIVIDALDECGDPLGRQSLLRALSKQISGNALPRNLRLLVTTRPESDILSALPSGPRLVHKRMGDVSPAGAWLAETSFTPSLIYVESKSS